MHFSIDTQVLAMPLNLIEPYSTASEYSVIILFQEIIFTKISFAKVGK